MLTYESIRKILDEEKATGRLTSIPERFFVDAASYLEKKAKTTEEEWKLDSANRRLNDIIEMRERKIINSAVNAVKANVSLDNLTPEERKFFDTLVGLIKSYRQSVQKSMEPKEAEEPVAVLKDIEEFVGTNLRNYGPFKLGDVATVPKPIAELLISKGVAEKAV